MSLRSIVSLLLAACLCNALAITGQQAERGVKADFPTPVRARTNAERFAAGMFPAVPRALAKYQSKRSNHKIVRALGRRQEQSATPIAFPAAPSNNENLAVLLTNTDDMEVTMNLAFDVSAFGSLASSITVGTNGYVGIASNGEYMQIEPFFTDLRAGYAVTGQSDATSLTLRWNVYVYSDPASGTVDFTMYYSTAQPGVWFVYYDDYSVEGDGRSAEVGAQNYDSGAFIRYSSATAFRSPNDGLVLAIDTATGTTTKQ